MIIRIINHSFHFECECLCRVFYPNEKINLIYDMSGSDPLTVTTKYEGNVVSADLDINGEKRFYQMETDEENAELHLCQLIFKGLCELTGYTPPWGLLTGVRPSKLLLHLMDDLGEEGAVNYFNNEFMVNPVKTDLALKVARNEDEIVKSAKPESFSLYVSIPFCPSRCSYCSFVSHSIANGNAKKILIDYINKLAEELAYTGSIARENGLQLESIYFGGGTPGILEPSQLDMLQCTIEQNFNLDHLREYTVEMGRPDTITPDKLRVLRLHNTDRISINPQTFNQETLDLVGRKHTVEQAVEAYRLAKSYGFRCINMDLIAGLPGEDFENFKDSLDTAMMLSPENITVHSLALKRSSNLNKDGAQVADGKEAGKMLEYASLMLPKMNYSPYYMYRQQKCVGNLENVGWCKGDTKGFYNVVMMEESHTVIAVGAGGVTKLCHQGSNKVDRIFNYKYPFEYISGFDVILDRKKGITEFYRKDVT